jgi:hypothetical protein
MSRWIDLTLLLLVISLNKPQLISPDFSPEEGHNQGIQRKRADKLGKEQKVGTNATMFSHQINREESGPCLFQFL